MNNICENFNHKMKVEATENDEVTETSSLKNKVFTADNCVLFIW